MLIALYFSFIPYLFGLEKLRENPGLLFDNLNSALIFMGLGISFSSLQDTTKTQNKLSLNVWESPKKGKIAIILMCMMILLFLLFGLIGYFSSEKGVLKDMSVGIIVLALGMFGFLKSAIEMFENHRKDKSDVASN
jgi:magnesium-transporting ATPase (P-type)